MGVSSLLAAVASGELSPEQALDALIDGPFSGLDSAAGAGVHDLGFARVDTHRGLRTGDPEVVYAAGKSPEQTVAIVDTLLSSGAGAALVTRACAETIAALTRHEVVEISGSTILLGQPREPKGSVVVICAGTSDLAVAEEAALTARAFGAHSKVLADVGVSGLHRLLAVRPQLEAADCLVVVAGMEGALPSVVGGLVGTPLVAVPTSVGYGVATGGRAALLSMLTSCAPGVVVSNIDNGFGAGVHAARVARQST